MPDPVSEFCRLAVERGLVSPQVVQTCLAKSRQDGDSLPRLIAAEAGLNPDAARQLYGEACRIAAGGDPDATLDSSLDREENLVAAPALGPVLSASSSGSSALAALASSGFGRVPTLAPVGAPADSTLVQAGSATDLAAILRPGGVLGGIRLEAELGRGAMGVVWRGQHQRLQRPVAVKLLNPALMRDPKIRARFAAESVGVAKLQHPNIVRVYDTSGPEDPFAFFVMEFVPGQALSDVLRARRFSMEEATRLIVTVARAVHYAHAQGIVHRDLKPGNILLDPRGVPFLTDFGIAKHADGEALTAVGEVLGTPAYMSPEQAEGQGALVDARADVYALGAILYRMLTGQPPFVAASSYEILNKVVAEPVVPPSRLVPLPQPLDAAIVRALAKKREQRFPSAEAFADALEQALAQPGPVVAPPVAPAPVTAPTPADSASEVAVRRRSRRGRAQPAPGQGPGAWTYALVLGVFLALGLAGALGYVAYAEHAEAQRLLDEQKAQEEAARAEQERADREALEEAWAARGKDRDAALAVARDVIQRLPDAFEAHALLGLYLDGGEERLAHLEQALAQQPQNLELLEARAVALAQLPERSADAEAAVTALGRQGEEGKLRALKVRGELALLEGAQQGAAIQFEQALSLDPSDADLFERLLQLLVDLRRYDTARKQAAAFAEHHPQDARAHAWSARAHQRLGRNQDARQEAERALELDPNSELAKAVLADLPRRPPPRVDPHEAGGDAHQRTHAAIQAAIQALQQRNVDRARQAFGAAMQERVLDCVPAILDRAKLAMSLGQPQIADHDLSSEAMRKADRAQLLFALELHANVKARLNQPAAAKQLFDRAVELAPDDHNLLHERGHFFERMGDAAAAQRDLERALHMAPQDAHYLVTLGGILLRQGDREGAKAAFKRALEEGDPQTWRGDKEHAEQALKELEGS
ncbi:MAG: protein kinase [Planctomycetota bacterium]